MICRDRPRAKRRRRSREETPHEADPWLAAAILVPAVAHAGDPLAHTYSIVARDPATGDFGVAVQSHWFQVGTVVPWAEAGVGAVATQSFARIDYGPKGLELMRQGKSAKEALDQLVAQDPEKDVRQVAMVDAQGRVAVWTGPRCIAAAGHQTGNGYSVQANLMDKATVWPAMAKAFESAKGDLADRMLAALEAAQAEGGDIRGSQSAALIVVKAQVLRRALERPAGRRPGGRQPAAARRAAPAARPAPRLRGDEPRRRGGRQERLPGRPRPLHRRRRASPRGSWSSPSGRR